MRSRLAVVAALAAVLAAGAAGAETCLKPSDLDQKNTVSLHVIDVGQADALALTCQDGSIGMIVDSGDKKEQAGFARMKAYLSKLAERSPKKRSVPLFVATHPDADHIGGGSWVLSEFSVKTFLDNGMPVGTKTYLNLRALAQKQAAAAGLSYVHAGGSERSFDVCPGVKAEVVSPADLFSSCENKNECSVVMKVTYGAVSFLLTGDAGKVQEGVLISDDDANPKLGSSVLKVGHHGSLSSTTQEFVSSVRPACAVVSSGKPGEGSNERYSHPRLPVVKRLLDSVRYDRPAPAVIRAFDKKAAEFKKLPHSKCVYHTAADGTVVFSTDGKKLACEAGK
ncbi:MAG: MBL fold metallo-hydrolase [Deltaproteobacteria bacterium]|nr:MBL fold metallo-hydrolase [Deltaproteobacteria bacterium]